jgi:hypothetical protein
MGGIWTLMEQQWRVRVTGRQRKTIPIELLVAAIMVLGEQRAAETPSPESDTAITAETNQEAAS